MRRPQDHRARRLARRLGESLVGCDQSVSLLHRVPMRYSFASRQLGLHLYQSGLRGDECGDRVDILRIRNHRSLCHICYRICRPILHTRSRARIRYSQSKARHHTPRTDRNNTARARTRRRRRGDRAKTLAPPIRPNRPNHRPSHNRQLRQSLRLRQTDSTRLECRTHFD